MFLPETFEYGIIKFWDSLGSRSSIIIYQRVQRSFSVFVIKLPKEFAQLCATKMDSFLAPS